MADEEEEVYEVESLLDKRIVDGRTEYLVKWIGYDDPEDNTWVDEEDCMCTELIKEFEKKLAAANKSPRKSRSPSRRVKFASDETPAKDEDSNVKEGKPLKKESTPKKTTVKKTAKKDKEFSVTAKVETEPVLRIEVQSENEESEDLPGIESSKIVEKKFSWRILVSVPVLLSIGVLAYFKIYRPDASQDLNTILESLKKTVVKSF